MKIATIKLSQLEDTLRATELQRDLQVRLQLYLEGAELQLKRLNQIKLLMKSLNLVKGKIPKSLMRMPIETRNELNKLMKDREFKI